MSLENPFSKKPILPPEETNPDSNIELIGALLGTDSAEAYRKTIAGEMPRPVVQKSEFKLDTFDDQAFEQHNQVEQGEAETLFGEKFIGPKDLQKAFGFIPENVPPVPFSREDLKDAQEKGLILCLNWDVLPDGTKLSVQKMVEIFGNKQKREKSFECIHFDKNDPTYITESPHRGWALVSDILMCKARSYLEQTDSLIKDCPDTEVYRQAIEEYKRQKLHIETLLQDYKENWKEIVHILSTLAITALTRDSFSERFQYMVLMNRKTGMRIHGNERYWTSSRLSGFGLVRIGRFDADGTRVDTDGLRGSSTRTGVSFSRRV